MWKNRNLRSLIEEKRQKTLLIRDFTTTPLPIPKIFLVVYLLKLSSECLVSYDPHFPGNDGTKNLFWRTRMRSENRADKTLVLLLNDKPAAVPITAIPAVHRWGSKHMASGRLYSRGPANWNWRRRFLGCGGCGYLLMTKSKSQIEN